MQIEAESGQCQQQAECRKLDVMVFVQPTTGAPHKQAWTPSFDEEEASATSVGLKWCIHTTKFQ